MYSFDDVIGNRQIVKNLSLAVRNKRVSHAYIFDAPKGMGKHLLARCFAKALLCSKKTGCGSCKSCISFDTDNNPDVIYVKSKKKSIGVDDVREIVKSIELRPYLYEYKIFIIEDADTMTAAAQNAVLKTLEEPPSYGVFILLSNNISSFLTTVLSRSVIFKLKPVGTQEIKKFLTQKKGVLPSQAEIFSQLCQGSPGKAVTMAEDKEFCRMRDAATDLLSSLNKKNLVEMFKAVSVCEEFKENIQDFLDVFIITYRDCIFYRCFNSDNFVIQKDKLPVIKGICAEDDIDRLTRRYDAVFEAKKQIKANGNFQLTMEVLFLKLKEK